MRRVRVEVQGRAVGEFARGRWGADALVMYKRMRSEVLADNVVVIGADVPVIPSDGPTLVFDVRFEDPPVGGMAVITAALDAVNRATDRLLADDGIQLRAEVSDAIR